MALTKEVEKQIIRVWSADREARLEAVTHLAAALLDLNRAVRELEAKVERAEQLAGRG